MMWGRFCRLISSTFMFVNTNVNSSFHIKRHFESLNDWLHSLLLYLLIRALWLSFTVSTLASKMQRLGFGRFAAHILAELTG